MAFKQLHPGAKWLFRVSSFFGWLFFMIFFSIWAGSFLAGFIGVSFAGVITYLIIIIILLIVLVEVYSRLAYHFWMYDFTGDQLRIERGIIWKRYSNIPYERVQNVDITRGIIARLCGFSTVNIQTAGYSGVQNNRVGAWTEGYIPAVPVEEAEKIREFLIKKISKRGRGQGL
jgi:membrane protein YdbS with pleckstrin-like domain